MGSILIDQVLFSLPAGGALELRRVDRGRVRCCIIPDALGGARGPETVYTIAEICDCFDAAEELSQRIGVDAKLRLAHLIAELVGPRLERPPGG